MLRTNPLISFAVVGLAALPIVALSAVGNTSAGDGLKERAARDKKAYEVRRPAVEEARAAARARRKAINARVESELEPAKNALQWALKETRAKITG